MSMIYASPRASYYFRTKDYREYQLKHPAPPKKTLAEMTNNDAKLDNFLNLIDGMLQYDPKKRTTAYEALATPSSQRGTTSTSNTKSRTCPP